HKETPLYVLCTAGMRLLPERQQAAILEDLVRNVPLEFDFLFSKSHAEVISGKQEGVYAWIGINFVLGRFDHEDEEDAVVTVALGDQGESLVRKRTVGILDMGGASLQIAYEVPDSGAFSSPQQEEAAKSLLAEFNLGCDVQHTGHVYRVYVNTFLGFGGNFARQRYEDLVLNQTYVHNRYCCVACAGTLRNGVQVPSRRPVPIGFAPRAARGDNSSHSHAGSSRCPGWPRVCGPCPSPSLAGVTSATAPCLPPPPLLAGCREAPLLAFGFSCSDFPSFSSTDLLSTTFHRIPTSSSLPDFSLPQEYCSQRWEVLTQRFRGGLYSAHADQHRLKYQCFKSAWMYEVLHQGFRFPLDYPSLHTAQLVYDREVQGTL
ncbi:Ectonucleoside triphosphate diphosphohydrolase 7, partial [Opisthocomus hoazin]